MKRFAFALSLVAAATFAAPLAAQSGNGPWWDPGQTATRSGRVDNRNGSVYGRNGSVYGNQQADGKWRLAGRDHSGNNVYLRTRYDSNGNLIQEAAHRNILGRYSVFDRQVVQYANNRNSRNSRNSRDVYRTRDRNNDGYDDRYDRNDDRNDRWDQNNGHDNGKHNGQYKNKGKNKRRG